MVFIHTSGRFSFFVINVNWNNTVLKLMQNMQMILAQNIMMKNTPPSLITQLWRITQHAKQLWRLIVPPNVESSQVKGHVSVGREPFKEARPDYLAASDNPSRLINSPTPGSSVIPLFRDKHRGAGGGDSFMNTWCLCCYTEGRQNVQNHVETNHGGRARQETITKHLQFVMSSSWFKTSENWTA